MIYVVDFGSQTAHLIVRRLKELGSPAKLFTPDVALKEIKKEKPQGIILSGGPSSVYEKGAPSIDSEIFETGVPILGICYGLQLMAHLLDGKVIAGRKEYGPAILQMRNTSEEISDGLTTTSTVWMSHGDEVVKLPPGFTVLGVTDHMPFAFTQNKNSRMYGLQFHPEVEHTEMGKKILQNFIAICNIEKREHVIDIKEIEQGIKEKVGDAYVIGAVSGGVDSTVAGILTARAIGKRFIPVYVDNGLMREGTADHVKRIFTTHGHIEPIVVSAVGEMLANLRGIRIPERKRKIIGAFYIQKFEEEMQKLIQQGLPVKFLLQGTIYSDVIESKGTKHASKIKSHHNVGGLPKHMKLHLLEPLRTFYKDEVRKIGQELGLPSEFVQKQVFPGPGYAIRIRGEVTENRLGMIKQADSIVLNELGKAGWLEKVYMSFPILTGASSTAVKGDGRFFGEVVALRVVQSQDVMTSTWAQLPYDLLQTLSTRIVNEVPGVSRVVYDITTKPPATMEWE